MAYDNSLAVTLEAPSDVPLAVEFPNFFPVLQAVKFVVCDAADAGLELCHGQDKSLMRRSIVVVTRHLRCRH
jgi:hypothetical protein